MQSAYLIEIVHGHGDTSALEVKHRPGLLGAVGCGVNLQRQYNMCINTRLEETRGSIYN